MKPILFFLLSTLSLTLPNHAQAPGVTIFEQSHRALRTEDKAIGNQAEALIKAGKTISLQETAKHLKNPTYQTINLPAPKSTKLSPTNIARLAKESGYRIGWSYLCQHCDQWHVDLAGGYAVTTDGVIATCAHVIEMDAEEFREGTLIAVDHTGKVFPVTSIIANNRKIDGALIKIDATTIPLPLTDQVSPGDAAYCFSRPLKQGDYFSEGIVNRFFWSSSKNKRGSDPNSLKALGSLKLNVSSRWAPGSSGSAVLDTFGNAIGHVALINTMGSNAKMDDDQAERTLITLHTATPARSMIALTKKPK